jgi:biopolymer transport protein ExbB
MVQPFGRAGFLSDVGLQKTTVGTKQPLAPNLTMKSASLFKWVSVTALCTFLWCGAVTLVQAQETAQVPTGGAPASGVVQKSGWDKLKEILHGEIYILLVMMAATIAWTAEGVVKSRLDFLAPPALRDELYRLMLQGEYQKVWEVSKSNKSYMGRVVTNVVERIGMGRDIVEHIIFESCAVETQKMKNNVNYISVIGVTAPMVGLVGTVRGMISAFETLGASGIGDPSGLASAIGKVLWATATGLIVAVPAFIAFYILKSKLQIAVMEVERAINHLFERVPYEHLLGAVVGEEALAMLANQQPTDDQEVAADHQAELPA